MACFEKAGATLGALFYTCRPALTSRFALPVSMCRAFLPLCDSQGISGLYVGYFTKAGHLGGCGALMALVVPRFKAMLGCD